MLPRTALEVHGQSWQNMPDMETRAAKKEFQSGSVGRGCICFQPQPRPWLRALLLGILGNTNLRRSRGRLVSRRLWWTRHTFRQVTKPAQLFLVKNLGTECRKWFIIGTPFKTFPGASDRLGHEEGDCQTSHILTWCHSDDSATRSVQQK